MSFKDHFSGHAEDYRAFRPSYPPQLFSELAARTKESKLAWDCATGSGQAAMHLALHFDQVIATDASAMQIANAEMVDGVSYSVAPAEDSGLDSTSVDLITVAQAIHWFDLAAFSSEANRVLKPGGLLAAWTYGLLRFENELDETIHTLYADIVGSYWPFERKLVESGYADLQMPFADVSIEPLKMTSTWSFTQLLGYLNTWSAVKAYEQDLGHSPLELVYGTLEKNWGNCDAKKPLSWPLFVRAWRQANS